MDDPNNWDLDAPKTITLDYHGDIFALVDAADYDEVLKKGPWFIYTDHRRSNLHYARRSVRGQTVYMHRWLMRKTKPPTKRHVVVDHKNGNGLDNRRVKNLRWYTKRDNRINVGSYRDNEELQW